MLSFDEVTRSAEALQRLKPQEVRALWSRTIGSTASSGLIRHAATSSSTASVIREIVSRPISVAGDVALEAAQDLALGEPSCRRFSRLRRRAIPDREETHRLRGLHGSPDPPEEVMIKLIVLFGHPEDASAFEDHWASHHVPLAQKIPNVRQLESAKVVGTPDGSEPPYHRVAELSFDGVEEMQTAMGSAEGQEAVGDFQNFATGGVTVLVAEAG